MSGDVVRRLSILEKRVDEIEKKVGDQSVVDAEIKGDIKTLRVEFESLKADILQQVSTFTSNTWKLIFILVLLIAGVIGVKEIPKVW